MTPEPVVRKRGRPPGGKGTRNREISYVCTKCGAATAKVAKVAQWRFIGKNSRFIRSRTTGWFCIECMEKDEDYTREIYFDSPGLKDTKNAST